MMHTMNILCFKTFHVLVCAINYIIVKIYSARTFYARMFLLFLFFIILGRGLQSFLKVKKYLCSVLTFQYDILGFESNAKFYENIQ